MSSNVPCIYIYRRLLVSDIHLSYSGARRGHGSGPDKHTVSTAILIHCGKTYLLEFELEGKVQKCALQLFH